MKKVENSASSHPLIQGKKLWKVADVFNDRVSGDDNVNERAVEGERKEFENDGAGVSHAISDNVRNDNISRKKKKSRNYKRGKRQSAYEQQPMAGDQLVMELPNTDVADVPIEDAASTANIIREDVVPEQKKPTVTVAKQQVPQVPQEVNTHVPKQKKKGRKTTTNQVQSGLVRDGSIDPKKNKAGKIIEKTIERAAEPGGETRKKLLRKPGSYLKDKEVTIVQKDVEPTRVPATMVSRSDGPSESAFLSRRPTNIKHKQNTNAHKNGNKYQSMRGDNAFRRSNFNNKNYLCTICQLRLYSHQLFDDHMKKRHPSIIVDRVSSPQPPQLDVSLVSYADKTKGMIEQQEQCSNLKENNCEESNTSIEIVQDSTAGATEEPEDDLPAQENDIPSNDTPTIMESVVNVTGYNRQEKLNWADEMTEVYANRVLTDCNGSCDNNEEPVNPTVEVDGPQIGNFDAVEEVEQVEEVVNSERIEEVGTNLVDETENNFSLGYVTDEQIANPPEPLVTYSVIPNEYGNGYMNNGYIDNREGSGAMIANPYVLYQDHPEIPYQPPVSLVNHPAPQMFHQVNAVPQMGVMAPAPIRYYYPPQHRPAMPIDSYSNLPVYVGYPNMFPTVPEAPRMLPVVNPTYYSPLFLPPQSGLYQLFRNLSVAGTMPPINPNLIPAFLQQDGEFTNFQIDPVIRDDCEGPFRQELMNESFDDKVTSPLGKRSIMKPDPYIDKRKVIVPQNSMPPGNGESFSSSDGGYGSPTETTGPESSFSDTGDDGQNSITKEKDQ